MEGVALAEGGHELGGCVFWGGGALWRMLRLWGRPSVPRRQDPTHTHTSEGAPEAERRRMCMRHWGGPGS